MLRVIWKYPIDIVGEQKVTLRRGFTPLKVEVQDDQLFLWCLVDKHQPVKDYQVFVVGTGYEVSDTITEHMFVNTVHAWPFVWHIFINHEELM
jgi:hypothetical protein